jgi:hypothetical protein
VAIIGRGEKMSLAVFGEQCLNHVQFVDYTKNSSIKSLRERSARPNLFVDATEKIKDHS